MACVGCGFGFIPLSLPEYPDIRFLFWWWWYFCKLYAFILLTSTLVPGIRVHYFVVTTHPLHQWWYLFWSFAASRNENTICMCVGLKYLKRTQNEQIITCPLKVDAPRPLNYVYMYYINLAWRTPNPSPIWRTNSPVLPPLGFSFIFPFLTVNLNLQSAVRFNSPALFLGFILKDDFFLNCMLLFY